MAELQPNPRPRMTVRADQGLIGVIRQRNGQDVVEYFVDDADDASDQSGIQQALSLAGAWQDIDSDDFLDELDRIRHESQPTPPITLPELDP